MTSDVRLGSQEATNWQFGAYDATWGAQPATNADVVRIVQKSITEVIAPATLGPVSIITFYSFADRKAFQASLKDGKFALFYKMKDGAAHDVRTPDEVHRDNLTAEEIKSIEQSGWTWHTEKGIKKPDGTYTPDGGGPPDKWWTDKFGHTPQFSQFPGVSRSTASSQSAAGVRGGAASSQLAPAGFTSSGNQPTPGIPPRQPQAPNTAAQTRSRIQTADGMYISGNSKHVDNLIKLLDEADCKVKPTPMVKRSAEIELAEPVPLDAQQSKLYRRCVGILLYFNLDRGDIQYCVKELSQATSAPSEQAFAKLKHLVRSTTCGSIMVGDCVLYDFCRAQAIVALSSAESEFYGGASVASEVIFVQVVLCFAGFDLTIKLSLDSSAARAILTRSGKKLLGRETIDYLMGLHGLVKTPGSIVNSLVAKLSQVKAALPNNTPALARTLTAVILAVLSGAGDGLTADDTCHFLQVRPPVGELVAAQGHWRLCDPFPWKGNFGYPTISCEKTKAGHLTKPCGKADAGYATTLPACALRTSKAEFADAKPNKLHRKLWQDPIPIHPFRGRLPRCVY
ncbi:unnamed protein product [Polarella glacialis]|uniref:Uncharacterized protein n=1 Tax=Polarella glacialis TaxID=89957 RepID=A0A813HDB7_POLGL|nr:unnamed protein product [Polarella glacialis]